MNDKEKKLAEQIKNAIDSIWCAYYTSEDIYNGDIEPQEVLQYERWIDNISEIIYTAGERNKVHKIVDLGAFEERMKEIYPNLQSICLDGIDENDDGKCQMYIAWLKFPYYSTDSDGGFFVFYTEEQFAQYMTSSIRMFTEEEIKKEQFEIEQYVEFYNAEHKAVFNLDKALYLYYKARMEMHNYLLKNGTIVELYDGSKGIIQGNDFENSETFNDVNYYVYPIADVVNYEMHLAKDIKLFQTKE